MSERPEVCRIEHVPGDPPCDDHHPVALEAGRPIPWGPGGPVDAPDAPYLIVAPTDHVIMALRSDADGSWSCSWMTGVDESRTLPEIEAFMVRVARFIEDEPVVP